MNLEQAIKSETAKAIDWNVPPERIVPFYLFLCECVDTKLHCTIFEPLGIPFARMGRRLLWAGVAIAVTTTP